MRNQTALTGLHARTCYFCPAVVRFKSVFYCFLVLLVLLVFFQELYRLAREDVLGILGKEAGSCVNWRKTPNQLCTEPGQCGKGAAIMKLPRTALLQCWDELFR